jgi:multiple sugar transport system permease protein
MSASRLPGHFSPAVSGLVMKLILLAAAILMLVPILFMVSAAFMPSIEIVRMPYRWIASRIEWINFYKAVAGNDGSFVFIRNIINSLFVSTCVSVCTVMLSAVTGYGLAKFRFRGRNVVFMAIMMTMMIPFETIMVPLYMVVLNLGLQNTYRGLIVPFLMNAFGIFMMRQYLQTFPTDILDAARIDGATEPGILARIVLVNSGPALASLAILTFRQQWDNLLWPLMVAQDKRLKTIPTYIVSFAEEKLADEGAMMAASLLASVPVIIMFVLLSRYFVGGAAVYTAGKE